MKHLRKMILLAVVIAVALSVLLVVNEPKTYHSHGRVIFTFDDSWALPLVVENVLPVMEEFGFKAITFFNTGSSFLNFEDMIPNLKVLADAGWEIGAHTHTHPHLNKISAEQLEYELSRPKELLEALDEITEVNTFAYPYGEGWNNETVYSRVRHYYKYVRPTEEYWQKKDGFEDPLGVTFDIAENTVVEQTAKAIQWAKKNERNVWFPFHGVKDNFDGKETDRYSILTKTFRQSVELVNASGLQVTTMKKLFTDNSVKRNERDAEFRFLMVPGIATKPMKEPRIPDLQANT